MIADGEDVIQLRFLRDLFKFLFGQISFGLPGASSY
jgi:hypothetical protein